MPEKTTTQTTVHTQERPHPPYYGQQGYPWDNHQILIASNGYFETFNGQDKQPVWMKIDKPIDAP